MATGDHVRDAGGQGARHLAQALERAAKSAFADGRNRFIQSMTRERLSGAGPQSLARRTGMLARSLGAIVLASDAAVQLTGYIGGGVPYARIHEFGGTIKPKKSKYLAIPLGPAKTAAGVGRAGPRAWPTPLQFIKTKSGKKFLVEIPTKVVQSKTTYKLPSGHTIRSTTPKKVRSVRSFNTTTTTRFQSPFGGGYITSSTPRKVTTSVKPIFMLVDSVSIRARLGFGFTFKREAERTLADLRARIVATTAAFNKGT